MHELIAADLPEGWEVGRSPIDADKTHPLDLLAPSVGPPATWHEVFTPGGQTRVLLRIVDGGELDNSDEGAYEWEPHIDAVLVAPGTDPFAPLVDGATLREIRLEDINRALSARWASDTLVADLRGRLGERADEPLAKPDRSDPDGFSAHVALRYLQLLAETPNPTHAISQEVGVPHATAQRWVVDARKRGHLPPANKRRAKR